jgi:hypothetical protein
MNDIIIDNRRIDAFADFLRQSETADPFDFCSRSEGFIYPERGGEGVLRCFSSPAPTSSVSGPCTATAGAPPWSPGSMAGT